MAIKLRQRVPVNQEVRRLGAAVNAITDEIEGALSGLDDKTDTLLAQLQAAINSIITLTEVPDVKRQVIEDPVGDYLRYDSGGEDLFLETLEGQTFQITMVEV